MNSEKDQFNNICNNYEYVPSILPPAERIIAIGDLHGDIQLTKKILKIAQVIDDNLNWIGGNTIVVQVGDQIDRCRPMNTKNVKNTNCMNSEDTDEASDITILKLFTDLHKQAVKKGGAVISLFGNHELMNIMGDMSYVSKKGLDQFNDYTDPINPTIKFSSGKEARKHAFAPGNEYGKFLACTRVATVIIGGFLFAHAGIIKEFMDDVNIKSKNDLIRINRDIRRWLLKLINKNYVDKIVRGSSYSIFWNRILGNIPPNVSNTDPICEKYLSDDVFEIFHIKSMIIGHTPQFYLNKQGINKTCGNKLIRVDIGGSDAFNKFDNIYSKNKHKTHLREAQVLEIINIIENNTEIKTDIYVLSDKGKQLL